MKIPDFKQIKQLPKTKVPTPVVFSLTITVIMICGYVLYLNQKLSAANIYLLNNQQTLDIKLTSSKGELSNLKNQDQYKRNEVLQTEIQQINKTYSQSLNIYEQLMDLRDSGVKTTKLEPTFARILKLLSERQYASAGSALTALEAEIDEAKPKAPPVQDSSSAPTNATPDNKPPESGFKQQYVQTDNGTFLVKIISANLDTTRVIVDTASESECKDKCLVLSLSDFVSRNGAFAGINGSFFCPESYPSCAGKTNSFDTLLMNKNKTYFNSSNNVYSVVPAVIFGQGWVRFVSRSLEWGRDTGIDSMIANHPLLLSGGNSQFSGSNDSKITDKGARCFIGTNGKNVYIGVVYNASTQDEVKVLQTLGIQDALGLDQGGSTALWFGGSYKAGPGRSIPNAILFVKR